MKIELPSFFSVVQNEGQRNVKRKVKCYNLDAITKKRNRILFDKLFNRS